MENSVFQNVLSFLLLFCASVFGSIDYCKNHTFDDVTHKNLMHFSKENSEREFAVAFGFKSLHCCSHGYRSIEWFKDGIPYPWSTDISTLIIAPESGNQTIYSQMLSEMDSGSYWCIVRNDTDSLRHDVLLKVSETSNLEDPPKFTYRPRDQRVARGQKARFYCEAFVGNINLPDARSEITWRKLDLNGSVSNSERMEQHIISREGNQVLGSYLLISNVQIQDYGHYVCRVSNTGDQFLDLKASLIEENKLSNVDRYDYLSRETIFVITIIILSATLSTISLIRFRSEFGLIYQRFLKKKMSEKYGNNLA